MNEPLKNGEKPNLRPEFCPFGPKLSDAFFS